MEYAGGAAPVFAGGMGDLRLYDAAGAEVPYLLVAPKSAEPRWRSGRTLPIPSTKKSSGFELDLGSPLFVDRIRVEGIRPPFLKRFALEGSGDRSRWVVLEQEGTLFDLPEEALSNTEVWFPPGSYRYLRVTWDDTSSGKILQPPSASARLSEPQAAGPPAKVALGFSRRGSEPGVSRFKVLLPCGRCPIVALELDVAPGHLLRRASACEARLEGEEVAPVRLGSSTLRRAVREGISAEDLVLPISFPVEPDIELVVEDGDNPPLDLKGVKGIYAPLPWIYFESADGEPLVAKYGSDLAAPRYDIEAMRRYVGDSAVAAAVWGDRKDLVPQQGAVPVASPLPTLGAPVDASKFSFSRKISEGQPGLAVLPLDAAVLAHSRNLTDIRIVDFSGRQVPYLLEKRDEPLVLTVPVSPAKPRKEKGQEQEKGISRYEIDLPYDTLPAFNLVLQTDARVFERVVKLTIDRPPADQRSEPFVQTVAEQVWRHMDQEKPASPLTIEVPPPGVSKLNLIVDEGDNSPLPVNGAKILLPSYRLRFFGSGVSQPALYYGQDGLQPPRYDISLLAHKLMGERANELSAGPEEKPKGQAAQGASSKKIFWSAIIAAAAILIFMVISLLLKGRRDKS